jgi:hypothetical protein
MSPEDTLKSLKVRSSSKVCRSLDAIFTVCSKKLESGDFDLSYSSVSISGAEIGVPKAQSIRNATGAVYRALIESFAVAQKNDKKRKSFQPSKIDGWVDEVKDVRLRFLMQVKLSELAEAQRLIKEIVPPRLEIKVDDRQGNVLSFTQAERRALEYLSSIDFLADHDFVLGKHGDVLDKKGHRILRPGTIDAIQKALKYL